MVQKKRMKNISNNLNKFLKLNQLKEEGFIKWCLKNEFFWSVLFIDLIYIYIELLYPPYSTYSVNFKIFGIVSAFLSPFLVFYVIYYFSIDKKRFRRFFGLNKYYNFENPQKKGKNLLYLSVILIILMFLSILIPIETISVILFSVSFIILLFTLPIGIYLRLNKRKR